MLTKLLPVFARAGGACNVLMFDMFTGEHHGVVYLV